MLVPAIQPFEWDQDLHWLCHAYNTCLYPTIGLTPFTLMFGRQTHMPVDIMLRTAEPTLYTVPQYVANLHLSLEQPYVNM